MNENNWHMDNSNLWIKSKDNACYNVRSIHSIRKSGDGWVLHTDSAQNGFTVIEENLDLEFDDVTQHIIKWVEASKNSCYNRNIVLILDFRKGLVEPQILEIPKPILPSDQKRNIQDAIEECTRIFPYWKSGNNKSQHDDKKYQLRAIDSHLTMDNVEAFLKSYPKASDGMYEIPEFDIEKFVRLTIPIVF